MRTPFATYGLLPRRDWIDTLRAGGWPSGRAASSWLWPGLGLALIALPVCAWAVMNTRAVQSFRLDDSEDAIQTFDSFSEPAVACAILNQEADRQLLAFCQREDDDQAFQADHPRGEVRPAVRSRTSQVGVPPTPAAPRPGSKAAAVQSLHALDAHVQNLERKLGEKLLVVYSRRQMWNAYVDRYLQLIREEPGGEEVALQAGCGLEAGLKCGRAEEVADMLRHVVRFHPELKTTASLRARLAEWNATNSPDLEFSKR